MTSINVAAGYTKPPCLSSGDIAYAQVLCTQQRGSGQEAVAGMPRRRSGLFGLGTTNNVDYQSAIKSAPCDWATLPVCAPPPKPSMRTSTSPSIMTRTLEVPPATVSVAPAPAAPAPTRNTPLIVGGLLLAAIVVGGAIYYVEKR